MESSSTVRIAPTSVIQKYAVPLVVITYIMNVNIRLQYKINTTFIVRG